MQALVYIFIAFSCAAVGVAAYFGLTFTPVEAIMIALVAACLAVLLMERQLRQRAEARLEKAVEDLSRLLSTDAQAGAVLGQRINALVDQNAGKRLESVEGDISVLGTVVRQVAESVSELEEASRRATVPQAAPPVPAGASGSRPVPVDRIAEPVIPITMLRQAMEEDRLTFHLQAVVTLPQRRAYGYDLVPRLLMEDGDYAERADFMPVRGGEAIVRSIELAGIEEAVTLARRARTGGHPTSVFVGLTRPTLADAVSMDRIVSVLDANRAVAPSLAFSISAALWQAMAPTERLAIAALVKKGAGLSLLDLPSLRLDFAALAGEGVRSVRVDAAGFISSPQVFTDFHPADIAAYLGRFGVGLIATGVASEEQILSLLEDGIGLAQGPYVAPPGPARPDLLPERQTSEATPRRLQA